MNIKWCLKLLLLCAFLAPMMSGYAQNEVMGATIEDPSGIGLRGQDSDVAFSQPPQIEQGNNSHPFSLSENQHRFLRTPTDFSPADSKSKVLILETGNPIPNPVRHGPSSAVVINGSVYFVDAGDGMWAAISHAYLASCIPSFSH